MRGEEWRDVSILDFDSVLLTLMGWFGAHVDVGMVSPHDDTVSMTVAGELTRAIELPVPATRDRSCELELRLAFELDGMSDATFVVDRVAFVDAWLESGDEKTRLVIMHEDFGVVVGV